MPSGINVTLYDGTTVQSSVVDLMVHYWDSETFSNNLKPQGIHHSCATNSSGELILDISGVTHQTATATAFISVYKLDAGDHRDSLIFQSKVDVVSVSSGYKLIHTVLPEGTAESWTRNTEWLTLPSGTSGENKIVGLYGVYLNPGTSSNLCALSCTAVSGYTVDWGDSSPVETAASGATLEHEFNYNTASSDVGVADVESCTITASTDTIDITAHTYQNNQVVLFSTLAASVGLTVDTPYYVVNATTNTFQVASASGGTAITLSSDTTGNVFKSLYRQSIVTVTPVLEAFTAVNFNKRHSSSSVVYSTTWLDIDVNAPSCTSLIIGSGTTYVRHRLLQQFSASELGLTSMSELFRYCYGLKNIDQLDTAGVTDAGNMFDSCHALQTIPLLDTSSVTDMGYMFQYCYSLRTIPLLDANACTTMNYMFAYCYALESIPLLDTAACTSMNSMFRNCYSLQSIPLLDTIACTSMTYMFAYCYALESIPLLDTASVTTMTYMFVNCYSLKTIPLIDTAACTNMASMFNNCTTLQTIPLIDTALVQSMANMFASCYALESIPLLNTSIVTNMGSMFTGCYSLRTIPLLDTAACTGMTYMFNSCFSLETIPLIDTSSCTSTANMFRNCYALGSIPLLDTVACTSMSYMFAYCYALESIPLLDTTSVTTMSGMFYQCTGLKSIPLLDTSACTNFYACFRNCYALERVPKLDASNSTNNGLMFYNCLSLQQGVLNGCKVSISYQNCNLSADALNEIYTALATITAQTITVTGNYGVAGDNTSIATSKGWTVTG